MRRLIAQHLRQLFTPANLMPYIAYLSTGRSLIPDLKDLAVIGAGMLVVWALFGVNLFLGRMEDLANARKLADRPLAGRDDVNWYIGLIIAYALASVILPLAVGAITQAALNAVAVCGYALAFQNRYAKRQYPCVKTASAVLATTLLTAGVLVGLDASVVTTVCYTGFIALWRLVMEVVDDAFDLEADRYNGIVTLVQAYGVGRVFFAVSLLWAFGFAVLEAIRLLTVKFGPATIVFGVPAAIAFVLLIVISIRMRRRDDTTLSRQHRIIPDLLLIVGVATVVGIGSSNTWLGLVILFAGPALFLRVYRRSVPSPVPLQPSQ